MTVAIKNKMDLAIGVAVGSSMQIALLVTPLMVILGWIIPPLADMTLFFNVFETAILFITVLYLPAILSENLTCSIVNYLIQDGKSNYLEGGLLIAVYLVTPTVPIVLTSDHFSCSVVLPKFRRKGIRRRLIDHSSENAQNERKSREGHCFERGTKMVHW